MSEEKKATVNVEVKLAAKLYMKSCDNICSDATITFKLSDVPVDTADQQVRFAAVDALYNDFKKGTGALKCMLDEYESFIAMDTIAYIKIKDAEIKRGE